MTTQISIDNRSEFAYDFARYRRVGRSSFLTGYRHLFGILLILAIVLSQGIFSPSAQADFQGRGTFPGKGSRQAWLQANKVFAEAKALSDMARYPEAIQKYKTAIDMYAFDSDYFHNLGFVYEKDGQFELAESAYRKATNLEPGRWQSWNGLKNVLYKEGKFKESKDACIRALACNPPAEDRASIQRAMGKLDQKLNSTTKSAPTGAQP